MKCPHCDKEVFGKGHNVAALYEEPKVLTLEEQIAKLQAEVERLKDVYEKAKKEIVALATRAAATTEEGYARAEGIIDWLEQALKGK